MRAVGRFTGAPLARLMCFATLATSVAARAMHGARAATAIERALSRTRERGRGRGRGGDARALAAAVGREWGFCGGAAELVIGTTLLSELGRAMERACGTRRFAGATLAARCAMEIVSRVAWRARGVGNDVSGPYGVVFALLAMYGREIPATATYAAGVGPLRFVLSDKSVTYFSALCLALGRGIVSARLALIGTFAGYVVTDGIGLDHRALAAPEWVASLCRGFGAPGPIIRVRASSRPRGRGGDGAVGVEPSAENIQLLVSMGFDEAAAARALRRANDDVQRATNILLTA